MNQPGIGHNLPTIRERFDDLLKLGEAVIANGRDIETKDQARTCDDIIAAVRTLEADIDGEDRAAIQPHQEEIDLIKLRSKDMRDQLALIKNDLTTRAGRYLAKQQDAAKAEAAERKRLAEEAEHEAMRLQVLAEQPGASIETQLAAQRAQEQAKHAGKLAKRPAKAERVKGDYSRRALGLRTNWRAEIDDPAKAAKHYADHPYVVVAIAEATRRAANKDANELRDPSKAPAGVRFIVSEKAF